MSTHNIGFYEEIAKLSLKYHQICTLFLLLTLAVPLGLNMKMKCMYMYLTQ